VPFLPGIESKIAGIDWDTVRPATFRGINKAIYEGIVKNKEADLRLLEIINHAIDILEKQQF